MFQVTFSACNRSLSWSISKEDKITVQWIKCKEAVSLLFFFGSQQFYLSLNYINLGIYITRSLFLSLFWQIYLKSQLRSMIYILLYLPVFRIRIPIIWSDPDPDPYQEALIWIRVAPKDYSGKKSLFFKIFNFFVPFRPVSEYIINIVNI